MDIENTLNGLLRMQQIHRSMVLVERDLAKGPALLAEIEATLADARAGLADAQSHIDDAAKRRRELEGEIEEIKVKISRYQDQLMAVKTNEQYRALTKEIETEKARIDACEESILVSMEETDDFTKVADDKKAILAREQARVELESAVVEKDCKRLEAEKAGLLGERSKLVAELPKRASKLFDRISEQRAGVALSVVEDGMCGECRMRCLPQSVEEARSFVRIVQCDMCSRILYAPPLENASKPFEAVSEDLSEDDL